MKKLQAWNVFTGAEHWLDYTVESTTWIMHNLSLYEWNIELCRV